MTRACTAPVLFHRHGRNATVVEAGNWYVMEDSWGTYTERTKMRMASRERGAHALGSTVKAMLVEAGNPSALSGRSKPSTITHRHLEIPEHRRFQIYSKLAEPKDEL